MSFDFRVSYPKIVAPPIQSEFGLDFLSIVFNEPNYQILRLNEEQ